MSRPHKTVEYDLNTVLSKENESSPTILLETETKPDHNIKNRKWPQSHLSPQVKWHAIAREPVKVTAWSPSRLVAVCKPTKSNGNHSKTWQPDPTAGTRRPLDHSKTWQPNPTTGMRRPLEVATVHQT
jgi:hypothetical protein